MNQNFPSMASLSSVIKRDLSAMGKWLLVGLSVFNVFQELLMLLGIGGRDE